MSLIKNFTNDLRDFDWNDLQDLDTIGAWPVSVKALLILLLFVACMAAGYFFHFQILQTELRSIAGEEGNLRIEYEQKALFAANLEEYQAQTVQMEESFAELLRQLPSETEVPGLVDDVANTGLGSGLEFANLEMPPEEIQEFYIEIPVNLEVIGGYHEFGTFVSGVASLGRIVTLHDFSITARPDSLLTMSIMARTYRYKDVDEILDEVVE